MNFCNTTLGILHFLGMVFVIAIVWSWINWFFENKIEIRIRKRER